MLEQKGVIIKVFKVIIKKLYLYINIYISPFFNHFAKLRTFFISQKTLNSATRIRFSPNVVLTSTTFQPSQSLAKKKQKSGNLTTFFNANNNLSVFNLTKRITVLVYCSQHLSFIIDPLKSFCHIRNTKPKYTFLVI